VSTVLGCVEEVLLHEDWVYKVRCRGAECNESCCKAAAAQGSARSCRKTHAAVAAR